MATRMPTLGPAPRKSPLSAVLGIAVAVGLIAGGGYWWKHRPKTAEAPAQKPLDPTEAANAAIARAMADKGMAPDPALLPSQNGAQAAANPNGTANAGNAQAPANAGGTAAGAPLANAPNAASGAAPSTGANAAAAAQLQHSGMKAITATINGPLESAIVEKAGPTVGPALTQVLTRTLVWWIRVPDDLLRGDRISVLYEERANEEPVVHAVRFESGKTGQTHKAFLYKAPGDSYPRFYEPDGNELEVRLSDAPLDDYEQVTSRLRDGRRHKGVDFKCPEGTPIKATFDGTITRKNWNFRGNGNSIELTAAGGRRQALYLHLSEIEAFVRPGTSVRRGQILGRTGNTGHSFAPHLHYQLMAGEDKVLDPFLDQKTWRRQCSASDRGAFEAEVRRLDGLIGSAVAGN